MSALLRIIHVLLMGLLPYGTGFEATRSASMVLLAATAGLTQARVNMEEAKIVCDELAYDPYGMEGDVLGAKTATRSLKATTLDVKNKSEAASWCQPLISWDCSTGKIIQLVATDLLVGLRVELGAAPTFVDLDGDGDQDLVVGESTGELKFFEHLPNTTFLERTGARANPLHAVNVELRASPTFVDLDSDGDQDLVVGNGKGEVRYFEHMPDATFLERTGPDDNPLHAVRTTFAATPTFVDLDGDGDQDLVVGDEASGGVLRYFERLPNATFLERTAADANPLHMVPKIFGASPAFVDFDGDGDLDLVVGARSGALKYFERMPDASFLERTGADANPLHPIDMAKHDAKPAFVDLDGDGDLDIVVGDRSGLLQSFARLPATTFLELAADANHLQTVRASHGGAVPAFVDLDGDGDQDLVVGDETGNLKYFERMPNATFLARTGVDANPFHAVHVMFKATPAFVDLDGDGDQDLVVGGGWGKLKYFERGPNAAFLQRTGASANPFHRVRVSFKATPTFVDLDGDGDQDLVVGESSGELRYFERMPDATFRERVGADANPLHAISVAECAAPTFADVDGDGDEDLVVGEKFGTLRYFERMPDATFLERTGSDADPFQAIGVATRASPTFVDFDGDGSKELVVGLQSGKLRSFKRGFCIPPHPCSGNGVCRHLSCTCLDGHLDDTEGQGPGAECYFCKAGYEPAWEEGQQMRCTACPAGKSSAGHMARCTACGEGTIAPSEGRLCSPCKVGKVPNHTKTTCEDCAIGRVASANFTCDECPAGRVATRDGTRCEDCPTGRVTTRDGTGCEDCPIGSVVSASFTCDACEAGRVATRGGTRCEDCPAGTRSRTNNKCEVCPAGKRSSMGSSKCSRCPQGWYSHNRSEDCSICVKGEIPTGLKDGCEECPVGRTALPGDDLCELTPLLGGLLVMVLTLVAVLLLVFTAFMWRRWQAARDLDEAIHLREIEKKHATAGKKSAKQEHATHADMLKQAIESGYRWRIWKSKIRKAEAELLKQERKYATFEAFLDIVQDGDIKLLRGSWLAKKGNIDRFRRRQDMKKEAFWEVNELRSQIQLVHFVIISYCWLHPVNPDPESKHLELIQHALKKRLEVSGEGQVQDIAIIIDYLSLAQHGEDIGENGEFSKDPKEDPKRQRTEEEQRQFGRGLGLLNIPYAHKQVQVWLMKWTPENHPKYMDRGWPYFEQAVAGLIKDTTKLVLLQREALNCESWDDIYKTFKKSADGSLRRIPPLLPAAFEEEIMERKFTNGKNPQAFVAGLYKRTFTEVIGHAEMLWFVDLAWGNNHATNLADILCECKRLKQLLICNNPIGKRGALALVTAASKCTTLELLDMTGNAMSEGEREAVKANFRNMTLELRVDGKTLKAIDDSEVEVVEQRRRTRRTRVQQEIEMSFIPGAGARTRPTASDAGASSSSRATLARDGISPPVAREGLSPLLEDV